MSYHLIPQKISIMGSASLMLSLLGKIDDVMSFAIGAMYIYILITADQTTLYNINNFIFISFNLNVQEQSYVMKGLCI